MIKHYDSGVKIIDNKFIPPAPVTRPSFDNSFDFCIKKVNKLKGCLRGRVTTDMALDAVLDILWGARLNA